jgi:hypothetical protein
MEVGRKHREQGLKELWFKHILFINGFGKAKMLHQPSPKGTLNLVVNFHE